MPNQTLTWLELEMLHALYHLRYMTGEQICRAWYKSRPPRGGMQRIWRLTSADVIRRTNTLNPRYGVVWSVGPEGLRILREVKAGRYRSHKPLSLQHIPHQIETNAVFLALASGEAVWERLPFAWATSKRNALVFHERRRDEFGVLRKRKALLIPDALITPKPPSKPRVFLELDRSTECLREQDGRSSIRRKLRAYRTFLATGDWYQKAFGDERHARVVFVLARRDRPTHEPEERDRRVRSITAAARELAREVSVKVVYLDDVDTLAAVCGVKKPMTPVVPVRPPEPCPLSLSLSREDWVAINKLHRDVSRLYPQLAPEMRAQIRESANGVQTILSRIAGAFNDASRPHASVHPAGEMQAEMHRMHRMHRRDALDARDASGAPRADASRPHASVHPAGEMQAEMHGMQRRDAWDARDTSGASRASESNQYN